MISSEEAKIQEVIDLMIKNKVELRINIYNDAFFFLDTSWDQKTTKWTVETELPDEIY